MSPMFQRLQIAAFPIFLLLLVQILLQARIGWPIVDGILIDTDSYMRMVRIFEFVETGKLTEEYPAKKLDFLFAICQVK